MSPTAAALAYGYGKEKPERVAVFDLGGGTFDFTLLELENDVFEVLTTAGDSFLGGDDLDLEIAELMADHCLEQHRWDVRQDEQVFERLRAAAEWVKCQLSDQDVVEVKIEELAYGVGGKSIDLEFELERERFEKAIHPLIARSFDVVVNALKESNLKPKDIDSVVMVGGSTRVPLVRHMASEFFKRELRTEIDPDLVVAQGAAIHGYALSGIKRKPNHPTPRSNASCPGSTQKSPAQKRKATSRASKSTSLCAHPSDRRSTSKTIKTSSAYLAASGNPESSSAFRTSTAAIS